MRKRFLYREPIEYAVPKEKIPEVVDKLFLGNIQSIQKDVAIDPSPIFRYLILYDESEKMWKGDLGLRPYNNRYFDPDKTHRDLIEFLY